MKKILVFAIMVIASLNVLQAQNFHFGVTGGVDLANMSDLGINNQFIYDSNFQLNKPTSTMIAGYHFGGITNYKINSHFSIECSILYTTCGAKISSNVPASITTTYSAQSNQSYIVISTPYTLSSIYNFSYFQIPIMAKFKLGNGLNFFAGPYFGTLFSAYDNDNSYAYTLTGTVVTPGSQDINNIYPISVNGGSYKLYKNYGVNNLDMGMAFGVGYQLPIGIDFSAKYSFGMANTFAKNFYDQNGIFDGGVSAWGKNRDIGISVSYLFGIHK